MSKPTIVILAILVLVLGGISYSVLKPATPSELDGFAQCLGDKGAVFYGAFWCSHCQNQKKLFGTAERLLPYVECSTPDSNGQLQICKDKEIRNYPTWIFADGNRKTGEVSLADLSTATQCPLTATATQ